MKLGIRIWILIVVLLLSVVAISPRPWHDGVSITSVRTGSPAAEEGVLGPSAATQPVMRERILMLNGLPTNSLEEYDAALRTVIPDSVVEVRTNKAYHVLYVPPDVVEVDVTDNVTNETTTITVPGEFNAEDPIGFRVALPATTNVRKGLDLTGGVRVLLRPEEVASDEDMALVLENIQQRLNVFGLSDVVVRSTQDFSGNQYILVEIAGTSEEAIVELLTSQGRFEARIGDDVVFRGGERDVTHVGRSAQEAMITRCSPLPEGGSVCEFFFLITLTADAAQRHADITRDLSIEPGGDGQSYLSKNLDLFLDGANVSSLRIGSGLRGRAETNIQISGSETGATQQEAYQNAAYEMKRLQTVLSTGSLPVKLEVVKSDDISPALGDSFMKNIWIVGLFAILAVVVVVATRYRDWRIGVPMVTAMLSEVVIVLGIAALIGWNLDLAAIAGILVAIGTGVDDQIIIIDEIKSGSSGGSWAQRLKKAFFIIFAAFFTLLAAMLPLMWAGAGLVRGFALTTVLGVTVGVLVTRPAFAAIAEKVVKTS